MMLYMNSEVFLDEFVEYESDKTILKAQYIIASTRIKKKDEKYGNVISAVPYFYPSGEVFQRIDKHSQKEAYFNQLDEYKPMIASFIKNSIEKNINFIFICSKKEDKNLHYLDWLSDYVYDVFGYPVYEYLYFASADEDKLIKYNTKKVLKQCKEIIDEQQEKNFDKQRKTERGREYIRNRFESMSKKELKKQLKEYNLYSGLEMTKEEMVDLLCLYA